MHRHLISIALGALIAAHPVQASAASHPAAEAQALELAKETIAVRSVRGEGNGTGEVAAILKKALVDGGWADGDVEVVPYEDTAYLIATWQGSDPSLGPIVISAHMDVVEAKPEDWERDPFTPVIENGYLYGRGASDTKFDAALAVGLDDRTAAPGLQAQAQHRDRLFGRRGNHDAYLADHRRAAQACEAGAQYRWRFRHARR